MVVSPKSKSGGVTFQATGADKDAIARTMGVDPDAEPDVYEFLCKALDAPLPHPWTEHADKKGRVFYWNPASRHSSWQHPLTPSHKSLVAAYRRIMEEEDRQAAIQAELEAFKEQVEEEVGKWRQSYAPDGTPYFYKIGTQNTRWDNPRDELMAHMDLRVKMLDELAHRQAQDLALTAGTGEGDLERTVDVAALADASAITDAASTDPAALADLSHPAALPDASPSQTAQSSGPPMLALPEEPEAEGSGQETPKKSSIRSFLGRVGRRGRKSGASPSASASEASDNESGAGTPKSNASSVRSLRNLFSSGFRGRSRSADRKKEKKGGKFGGLLNRLSPFRRQREELAALKVTRNAKRFLQWNRAKKYEAALCIQKQWRGFKGRQAFRDEVERVLAALRAQQALPPELEQLERSLMEVMNSPLGKHRNRIQFERSQLLAKQGDIDLSQYILPDEIALHHGINFDIPLDKAVFNIIRPLLLRPLPVPWQILQRDHGRIDFYHAGVKEERRLHPLHTFFGEVITFLKAHVYTNVPMVEPMTAQVFREASPMFVRQRLGVWEGPLEDTTQVGGVRFKRLVPGEDKDCAEGEERVDDPRLEATANVTFRLEAWLHLWLGFSPEEPFPFLEGRMHALASQVSEHVVVAPGAATEALLAQLRGAPPLAVLAVPANPILDEKEPEVLPLTKEEDALQPIVTGTLGKAYGAALAFVAKMETDKLEGERPPKPEVVEEEESEGEYTEVGEDEEYEDSFAEEEEEGAETESEEASEPEEDISTATTAAQTPQSGRRPMQDVDALRKELAEEDVEEHPPKEVDSFLPGYNEQAASDWASRMLRPLTPPEDRKQEPKPWNVPGSPGKRPWHRVDQRVGQAHLWGDNQLLADSQMRLELKEPPLEDWGKGPKNAAKASQLYPGSPVSFKVPLSPKDKARAAAALPHLAEPMKKDELLKLRQEQQEKVDTFTKSLMQATNVFENVLQEAPTPPGSPSGRWRCGPRNSSEREKFRSGRPDLVRPHLPANLSSAFGDDEDSVCPVKGCVARANSPTKGSMPTPPHLEGATRATKKNGFKAWPVTRCSSAGPAFEREKPQTRYETPRPRSAGPRARKKFTGLLPPKTSKAGEMAAQSCRRFLSRTCGTMQLALATFDSTGDGKFNRWEWESGLKKLGYEANYDVQEIFTILDKRRHHVLTLSDLFDHYNGRPITEGLPDPGLRGIASEIILEAMIESLDPVITQALSELLQKELLAPRGPPFTLPSMKGVISKKRDSTSTGGKKLARNPNQTLSLSGDDRRQSRLTGSSFFGSKKGRRRTQLSSSDMQSTTGSIGGRSLSPKGSKSPGGKKGAKKNIAKLQTVGRLLAKSGKKTESAGDGTSSPKSTDGTLKGTGSMTGQLDGTLSGPLGGSEMSLSGTPFNMTTSRKKGMLGSTGMSSIHEKASSSSGLKGRHRGGGKGSRRNSSASKSPQPADRRHSSPKPGAQDARRRSSVAGLVAPGMLQAKGGPQRRPASRPQRRNAVKPENKYVGYRFVKDDPPESELGDWEGEKRLPWMPRATEDVVRTYGHIFRLLNDPKTKQLSTGQKPHKKSLHVSVPRMPTVPPGRGSFGLSDSGAMDGSSAEEDATDGLGPLQNMKLASGKKIWGTKSSPELHTSALSTTVGTARPSSAASSQASEDDPDRMRVSLPKLMKGGSPIDAEMRRRVPII